MAASLFIEATVADSPYETIVCRLNLRDFVFLQNTFQAFGC